MRAGPGAARELIPALEAPRAERPAPEVVDKGVQIAAGLYPVASCADLEALTARVHPPEDPALRARVTALQPRADRFEALCRAGKYEDGLARGEPLLVEIAALPYPPLRAQVQFWVGDTSGLGLEGQPCGAGPGNVLTCASGVVSTVSHQPLIC